MALGISAEQQGTVDQKRKAVRPSYYDASQGNVVPIGEELEAFFLLADPDLLEEMVDRLGEANSGNPDRDALYTEALILEFEDASARLTDFDVAISGFGTFRDRILQSPVGTSTEVAPLVQDVQREFAPIVEERERVFHAMQVANVLDILRQRVGGTADEILQRESWTSVIAAYR